MEEKLAPVRLTFVPFPHARNIFFTGGFIPYPRKTSMRIHDSRDRLCTDLKPHGNSCGIRPSRFSHRSNTKSGQLESNVSILSHQTTRVCCLLDSESKTRAAAILTDMISSVDADAVRKAVFCSPERSRFQTWGLCTRSMHNTIIAAMTFRRHVKLGLIELGLVACSREYQGEGFGGQFLRLMMDKWRREGMTNIIVFADFSAMGFFRSVGFSLDVPFPRDLYDCWIDKYSQSVLMCFCFFTLSGDMFPSASPTEVDVLVFVDNTDKNSSQTWVTGLVLRESDESVTVQYSYFLRTYTETLSVDSIRLKLK